MTWLDEELRLHPQPVRAVRLPERYRHAQVTHIPEAHPLRDVTLRYVSEFFDQAARGIAPVLLGPTAEWKTYCAAAIVGLVGAQLQAEFFSVPDECAMLAIDRYSAATRDRLAGLMTVPFLVLDDFFWPDQQSWEFKQLVSVFVARFNNLRPTLITGNLVLPEGQEFETLVNSYGPLLTRRIREAGGSFIALLDHA